MYNTPLPVSNAVLEIVAQLLKSAFREICTATSLISPGRQLELYEFEGYHCEFRNFASKGIEIVRGTTSYCFDVPAVPMNACLDQTIEGIPWLTFDASIDKSSFKNFRFRTMPGPCIAGVLGNDGSPVQTPGMRYFKERLGCSYTAHQDYIITSTTSNGIPPGNYRHELTLTQFDPGSSLCTRPGRLPGSVKWGARYQLKETKNGLVFQEVHFMFTAKLPLLPTPPLPVFHASSRMLPPPVPSMRQDYL